MELWMHLGSFLSTQEARVELGYRLVQYSYASFVLSNLQSDSSVPPLLHGCSLHIYHFLISIVHSMSQCLRQLKTHLLKKVYPENLVCLILSMHVRMFNYKNNAI